MATARIIWENHRGDIEVEVDDHLFGLGGQGDGFCYAHQSFDCLDTLDDEQRRALNAA